MVLNPGHEKVMLVLQENLFFWVETAQLLVRVTEELLRQFEGLNVLSSLAVKHDWEKMTESVQNHIGSLNWGYRVSLREKKVVYENAYGRFIGPHRIVVIIKLYSMPLPCLFKIAFIDVSGENHFKCVLRNQIRRKN